MAAPTVEIGMPTRGNGPYVTEALDSVLAQGFGDWTLAVYENGPGDPALARTLAPYLEDPRVRHVVRGADLGLVENHTRILRDATAEYLAILHDDDVWRPGFLARRVEFLDAHPECAFVFGGFETIDETGAVVARTKVPLPAGVNEPAAFVPPMLRANRIGMPSVLARRSAYEAVGAAFADAGFPMIDYEMWIRLGARFPVGVLAVEDAAWRFHRRQRSANERRWGEAWLRFYDLVEETLAEVEGIPVDREHLRRQRAVAHICAALDSLEAREPAAARAHLRGAVAARRSALLDPRVVAAAAGLRLGEPGIQLVGALRAGVKRARGTLGPLAARARAAARRRP